MTIKAKPKQKIFKEVVVGDITDHVIYPPEEEEEKEEETALEEVRQVHEGARESTNLDLDKEANEHVKMDSDNDQGETLGCSFRFLR